MDEDDEAIFQRLDMDLKCDEGTLYTIIQTEYKLTYDNDGFQIDDEPDDPLDAIAYGPYDSMSAAKDAAIGFARVYCDELQAILKETGSVFTSLDPLSYLDINAYSHWVTLDQKKEVVDVIIKDAPDILRLWNIIELRLEQPV